MSRWLTRDRLLPVIGVLGLAHETLVAQAERPSLIAAFVALATSPIFLRADERRHRDNGG